MDNIRNFVHLCHDNVDSLTPQLQCTLRNVPEGRSLTTQAKRCILRDGNRRIRSRTDPQQEMDSLGVKPLLLSSWNTSSLIDFEHWTQVNEDLRCKGVILPCDYIYENSQRAHSVAITTSQTGRFSIGEAMKSPSSTAPIDSVRPSQFPGRRAEEMRYEVQSKAGLRHHGYSQVVGLQEGIANQPASLVNLSFIALDAPSFKGVAEQFFGVVLEVFGHCLKAI